MKKVLSLLLVCAMIFSMALVGSAAGEGYTVTNGTINATHGRFYLNVASKTAAGSGYLTIKYDPEKVTLLKQVRTQTGEDDEGNPIYSTTYEDYTSGNFAVAQSGCSFADQKADVSKGNVVVQWFNTSKVSAGTNVFRLWFKAKDNSGDGFTESTFTLITNEAERVALGAEKGPIYVGTEAGDVMPTAEAMTWSYKNATVKDGGDDKWEAQDTAPTGWTNPATEGATSVVVFGKNTTAKALADGDYKVKFGENEYLGKASTGDVNYWAIVIYDASENGQYITAGNEYTGTASCGTDSWSVKVTPVAGNSNVATKVAD